MIGKIAVLGGDRRQGCLAQMLCLEGYEAQLLFCGGNATKKEAFKALGEADAIILPLPATRDGVTLNAPNFDESILLSEILEACQDKPILSGGSWASAEARVINYADRGEFKIKNGLATAEGAIALAIDKTNRTLAGSRALVIGYGYIGKPLARMLDSMGSIVTASARKTTDLAYIEANGIDAVHTQNIASVIGECDIIFNTVPAPVLGKRELAYCKSEALIIELASSPGGIDTTTAGRLRLNIINAPSLPGKTAPYSAAGYIKETVLNIFKEMEL